MQKWLLEKFSIIEISTHQRINKTWSGYVVKIYLVRRLRSAKLRSTCCSTCWLFRWAVQRVFCHRDIIVTIMLCSLVTVTPKIFFGYGYTQDWIVHWRYTCFPYKIHVCINWFCLITWSDRLIRSLGVMTWSFFHNLDFLHLLPMNKVHIWLHPEIALFFEGYVVSLRRLITLSDHVIWSRHLITSSDYVLWLRGASSKIIIAVNGSKNHFL